LVPRINRLLYIAIFSVETCYAVQMYNKLFKATRTQAISIRYLQNTIIIQLL